LREIKHRLSDRYFDFNPMSRIPNEMGAVMMRVVNNIAFPTVSNPEYMVLAARLRRLESESDEDFDLPEPEDFLDSTGGVFTSATATRAGEVAATPGFSGPGFSFDAGAVAAAPLRGFSAGFESLSER
jgi:hypothetical protein